MLSLRSEKFINGRRKIKEGIPNILKLVLKGCLKGTRCSGEKTCFGLAATRWISGELLMVQPGPVVDRAMWVAAGVVLGGSRLLAVEVRYGGAGCDDRGRRCYVSREWC
uniref:Uncharacterized protein n=1 Tax=Fagus sylvatica TaxID=28930 RepID=A0A2N9H0V0_FAGSY